MLLHAAKEQQHPAVPSMKKTAMTSAMEECLKAAELVYIQVTPY